VLTKVHIPVLNTETTLSKSPQNVSLLPNVSITLLFNVNLTTSEQKTGSGLSKREIRGQVLQYNIWLVPNFQTGL